MPRKPRAALYHRVSTIDQNPRLARAELRATAKRVGAGVELEVEETGSGANNNRPGLNRILEAARRHKIDVVICWKLDRFGRSTFDLLNNLRILERANVTFIASSQFIELKPGGDPLSQLQFTILAAVAEFERAQIQERTRLGLAHARRRGIRLGRPSTVAPINPELVRELRRQDYTWTVIADSLGVTERSLRRAVG